MSRNGVAENRCVAEALVGVALVAGAKAARAPRAPEARCILLPILLPDG
jgi:hypothetical protein